MYPEIVKKKIADDITVDTTTNHGLYKLIVALNIYMIIGLTAIVVIIVLPLKAIFGRERPTRIKSVKRICNMRDREKEKSMPSGDSVAAAYYVTMYFYLFDASPWIFVGIPLVAMGRVYAHCHWFGDTIVGGVLSVIIAHFLFSAPYFASLSKPFIVAVFKLDENNA